MNLELPLSARLNELADMMTRRTRVDGIHSTAMPRLSLIRSERSGERMPSVYRPSLCVIAQGSKRITLGRHEQYIYDRSCFLVASVDLPIVGEVLQASPSKPYLCVCLQLELQDAASMLLDTALPAREEAVPARGLFLSRATVEFIDAVLRLLNLLDSPQDIPALAPLVEREIVYRLLKSKEGWILRQIITAHSQARRIAEAIEWLKKHFHKPLRIESLAQSANMSTSSFHAHFKRVTAMSPLQFQKQLRLQEARRLLVGGGLDAASAGYRVGYESPSQFSREYRRLFGAPPGRDVQELRA